MSTGGWGEARKRCMLIISRAWWCANIIMMQMLLLTFVFHGGRLEKQSSCMFFCVQALPPPLPPLKRWPRLTCIPGSVEDGRPGSATASFRWSATSGCAVDAAQPIPQRFSPPTGALQLFSLLGQSAPRPRARGLQEAVACLCAALEIFECIASSRSRGPVRSARPLQGLEVAFSQTRPSS